MDRGAKGVESCPLKQQFRDWILPDGMKRISQIMSLRSYILPENIGVRCREMTPI
jgi:hypothetical protein